MANPGAAGSVDTPLMRLPATKALPDLPDTRLERAPRADGRTDLAVGSRLALTLPPQALHLFDRQGLAMPRTVELALA